MAHGVTAAAAAALTVGGAVHEVSLITVDRTYAETVRVVVDLRPVDGSGPAQRISLPLLGPESLAALCPDLARVEAVLGQAAAETLRAAGLEAGL